MKTLSARSSSSVETGSKLPSQNHVEVPARPIVLARLVHCDTFDCAGTERRHDASKSRFVGKGTVTFKPDLGEIPDEDTVVETVEPYCPMRSTQTEITLPTEGGVSVVSLSLREAL